MLVSSFAFAQPLKKIRSDTDQCQISRDTVQLSYRVQNTDAEPLPFGSEGIVTGANFKTQAFSVNHDQSLVDSIYAVSGCPASDLTAFTLGGQARLKSS